MTDDIVARLREDAEDHKDVAGCCDCDPKDTRNWQHALNNEEAADEIEQLRAMKGRLLSALRVMDERAALAGEKTNG